MSKLSRAYQLQEPVSVSIPLKSIRLRWAFGLFILLIATGFCWETAHVWLAAEYAASAKPELWQRAAQREPDNAAYWAQLGLMEEWDFERGDLAQAAADYERAVAANPRADGDWLELAGIYERRGQISLARSAYEKARRCHPLSALVAWRYGSFLLRREEYPAAYAEIRRALLADSTMTGAAVSQCWGISKDAAMILNQVVPARKQHLLLAMNLFLSERHADAALATWERLAVTNEPIEMPASVPLMDDLIRAGRITEAWRVWKQALRAAGWPEHNHVDDTLVFDGGFEEKLVNGGFGWRAFPMDGVSIELDHEVAHSGTSSLRVTFEGDRNVDFRNLLQYVPVEPLHSYEFSAFLRTKDISTENGLGFELFDFHNSNALDVTMESLTGTHPWTQVSTEFKTGPSTKVVTIALRRVPSWKIDNKLRGTVWADDVQLRERNDPVRGEEQ